MTNKTKKTEIIRIKGDYEEVHVLKDSISAIAKTEFGVSIVVNEGFMEVGIEDEERSNKVFKKLKDKFLENVGVVTLR